MKNELLEEQVEDVINNSVDDVFYMFKDVTVTSNSVQNLFFTALNKLTDKFDCSFKEIENTSDTHLSYRTTLETPDYYVSISIHNVIVKNKFSTINFEMTILFNYK